MFLCIFNANMLCKCCSAMQHKPSFYHPHTPARPALTLIARSPMLPVSTDPRFHPYHLSCGQQTFIPFLSHIILCKLLFQLIRGGFCKVLQVCAITSFQCSSDFSLNMFFISVMFSGHNKRNISERRVCM